MVTSSKPTKGNTVSPFQETSSLFYLCQKYLGKKKEIVFFFTFFQYLSVGITEVSTQGMYNLSRTQYIEFCLQATLSAAKIRSELAREHRAAGTL